MASKSSYLPRLGFRDGPILPLHSRTSPPIRKKPSEYDLSDLSPRSDDARLESEPAKDSKFPYSDRRSPSPSVRLGDRPREPGSGPKPLPKQRILFAGPPPPIAVSQVLYRDEEDRDTPARHLEASSFTQNINSVLFDRASTSPTRTRDRPYDAKPDTVWPNLQRRERALQQELQHLLDAQSAGLAATLDPSAIPPSSATSDAGSTTTTTTTPSSPPSQHRRHVTFTHPTSTTTTSSGTLVPVRQPRPPKPLTLRAARAQLARTITLLADLKAEEDAHLTSALSTRKQALAQLRRWTARRDGIRSELKLLEEDGEEPLGRELRELELERGVVGEEIRVLEERLRELKRRKKGLDGRVEEVKSRREAGLSGYRGALGEVEGRIGGVLARPGVRPLDGEFLASAAAHSEGEVPLGGVEFLRLRPERRTAEMAREWWEGEVAVLERRKREVDVERAALEEGVEVWKGAVNIVSEFEAGLRREMRGEVASDTSGGKGKGREGEPASSSPPTPEQAMFAQLDKMRAVIAGLQERLLIAEGQGWNLLICAIGAELEAFRQAAGMLREALRAAGFDVPADDDDDAGGDTNADGTPRLEKPPSLRESSPSQRLDEAEPTRGGGNLVDLHEAPGEEGEPESDNEVPPDLLSAVEEEHGGLGRPALSREDTLDSENEVPLEFLTAHEELE